MHRREALAWCTAVLLASCRGRTAGSGVRTTVDRSPGAFAELDLRGDFDVDVALGGERHEVHVSTDANLTEFVRLESNGRRLTISVDAAAAPTQRVALRVVAPDVVLVRCAGNVDVRLRDVRNARLQLDLDGEGSFSAVGSTQKLKVFLKGSGQAHLERLDIQEALVHVSGTGRADIAAPRHLEVELHGSATVTHAGTPVVESTIRDASKLERRP